MLVAAGVLVFLVALALLVPSILAGGLRLSTLTPARTEIPDLVGMRLDDAQAVVRSHGLELRVLGERVSDNYPKGTIIQQSPVAGFQQTGGPMLVTVSAGQSAPARLSTPPGEAVAPTVCVSGGSPAFVLGFAELKARVGAAMGDPLECEHTDPASGDTIQRTSTGLAYYRQATNTPSFTNGSQRWALVDGELREWEGDNVDPPSD
jgi:serine/threonine-protein kinase